MTDRLSIFFGRARFFSGKAPAVGAGGPAIPAISTCAAIPDYSLTRIARSRAVPPGSAPLVLPSALRSTRRSAFGLPPLGSRQTLAKRIWHHHTAMRLLWLRTRPVLRPGRKFPPPTSPSTTRALPRSHLPPLPPSLRPSAGQFPLQHRKPPSSLSPSPPQSAAAPHQPRERFNDVAPPAHGPPHVPV